MPKQKMMSIFTKKSQQRSPVPKDVNMMDLDDTKKTSCSESASSFQQLVEEDHRPPVLAAVPKNTLARMISKQSWHEVESLLSSTPVESIQIDERGSIHKDNILHFACRFNAPLSIVRLIANRFPRSLVTPDSSGRFVIHVASKYGASPLVIHYLICENHAAAGVQDDLGKAPIHYIGEYYTRYHEASTAQAVDENMLRVVRILKAAAPESFNLEDQDDCNAIEYAIESNADIKVIKAMQRAARDDWRDLKSKHRKPHEELARDLERNASEMRMNLHSSMVCDFNTSNEDAQETPMNNATSGEELPSAHFKSYVAKSA